LLVERLYYRVEDSKVTQHIKHALRDDEATVRIRTNVVSASLARRFQQTNGGRFRSGYSSSNWLVTVTSTSSKAEPVAPIPSMASRA
jgi:hypothetical protein